MQLTLFCAHWHAVSNCRALADIFLKKIGQITRLITSVQFKICCEAMFFFLKIDKNDDDSYSLSVENDREVDSD